MVRNKKSTQIDPFAEAIEKFQVTIELIQPMLGTVPKDPEVYARYIATKAPLEANTDDEVDTVPKNDGLEAQGWTGFHTDEAGIFIYNYMIRGFLESAIESLQGAGVVKKIHAYGKWLHRFLFIEERRIHAITKAGDLNSIERPIRGMTPKGERVALTRSDQLDEGTQFIFTIKLWRNSKSISRELIEKALAYGEYVGLGQWRGSGGYGQFKVVKIEDI